MVFFIYPMPRHNPQLFPRFSQSRGGNAFLPRSASDKLRQQKTPALQPQRQPAFYVLVRHRTGWKGLLSLVLLHDAIHADLFAALDLPAFNSVIHPNFPQSFMIIPAHRLLTRHLCPCTPWRVDSLSHCQRMHVHKQKARAQQRKTDKKRRPPPAPTPTPAPGKQIHFARIFLSLCTFCFYPHTRIARIPVNDLLIYFISKSWSIQNRSNTGNMRCFFLLYWRCYQHGATSLLPSR